jgi:hypothetical protein
LLRLSLFQVTVGMALVLLVGTLNRVMIVELEVPATLVGVMLALPLVFAPFRALIGFRSDIHKSGARLAPRPLHLEGHDAAIRRLRDHALRASGAVGLWRGGRCAALDRLCPAPRWPSCWSAPACTPCRPWAWRWPPIWCPRRTSPRSSG